MKIIPVNEEKLIEKSNKEHRRAINACKGKEPEGGWKPYSVFHHTNYGTGEGFLINNDPNKLAPLIHTLFHFCKENNISSLNSCFDKISKVYICRILNNGCEKISLEDAIKSAENLDIEEKDLVVLEETK